MHLLAEWILYAPAMTIQSPFHHVLQVVPESLRSSIYAFDRCFEGAISALSAPLVGLIAERWYHYASAFHGSTPQQQLSNAAALGNGLLVSLPLLLSVISAVPGACPWCSIIFICMAASVCMAGSSPILVQFLNALK